VRKGLRAWGPLGLPVVLLSVASAAWGQDRSPSSAKPVSPSTATPRVTLPAISVSTERKTSKPKVKRTISAQPVADAAPLAANGSGPPNVAQGTVTPPTMASQTTVTGRELNTRPVTRPGEVLEAVPGLIVTQHSGEGKANQYFLRGYNLDHGTDLAITIDGMRVNMRTHGHGQGYADTSAGAIPPRHRGSPGKGFAQVEAGSFGHRRAVTGMSAPVGSTGSVLVAGELVHFDGPWGRSDDFNKRWSRARSACR
jgi:TonB-dependent receptor-like protein